MKRNIIFYRREEKHVMSMGNEMKWCQVWNGIWVKLKENESYFLNEKEC
jgi:hypothetical protein